MAPKKREVTERPFVLVISTTYSSQEQILEEKEIVVKLQQARVHRLITGNYEFSK